MPPPPAVVLNCAGLGRRLGLGQTKALIDMLGRPLIDWQLDGLERTSDLRVVVGYNAGAVIDVVRRRRPDAIFIFNQDFATTATGDSLALACRHIPGDVLSIDGDLLVSPLDIQRMLLAEGFVVGITAPLSDQAVYVDVATDGGEFHAAGFAGERKSAWEWTGLVKCDAQTLARRASQSTGPHHVYELLEPMLPCRALTVETREVDTAEDYERAMTWLRGRISGGRWA